MLASDDHAASLLLISAEREGLLKLTELTESASAVRSGLTYLEYLKDTWMNHTLWQSWSQQGQKQASNILGIPIEGVIPTTNHLESFNGVLKCKHIARWQHGGKHVRFDVLIYLLVIQLLPGLFQQREAAQEYYSWLAGCFQERAGGINLLVTREVGLRQSEARVSKADPPIAWWTPEREAKHRDEAMYIASHGRIVGIHWPDQYTVTGRCASTHANVRELGHLSYMVRLNVYGWGACECLNFQAGHGACKHLHAMWILVPQLGCPFSFRFPCMHAEALEI